MNETLRLTVLTVFLLTSLELLADPVATPKVETHYIGFKGNGTGVFPDDCTPVTAWKQYDLKTETDEKGKPKTVADKSKPNPVNIVWKTHLPKSAYYGNNSGAIVAGGKVFVLIEPTTNSLGPILCCLDPQNGNILWQADCNHIDLLPEGVREQTRKELCQLNAFEVPFKKWATQFTNSDKELAKGALPADKKAQLESDRETARAELLKLGFKNPHHGSKGPVLVVEKGDEIYDLRERLTKVGYPWFIDPWIDCAVDAVGRACSTPCSDGERIYVVTPFQDLFCIDMNGKILWQQYWGDGKMVCDRANYYPSPILVDGMVIRYRHLNTGSHGAASLDPVSVRVFDKLTGKLLYTVKGPKTDGAYFIGTPQILTVDGVRLLYLHDGRIIRAGNGEVLLEETIDYSAHARTNVGFGDWLWTINGHEGGGYGGDRRKMKNTEIMAHQFSWSDAQKTKLEHKAVWRCDGSGNVIGYYQGMLFHTVGRDTIGTRDAFTGAPKATGKKISQAGKSGWINAPLCGSQHVFCFANDMIFSPSGEHHWNFASAKDLKLVSLIEKNGMEFPPELNVWGYGEQPFLSGNRLFLRKCWNDPWVYCIGDPKVPTKLSAIHTKPLPPVGK